MSTLSNMRPPRQVGSEPSSAREGPVPALGADVEHQGEDSG